ncbi:MAG: cytoskeletal protein CcmA (bactofilin family) [Lentimonas sp.]|jgi:cytoskeletal protein CcmA (bactofilin family)
MLSSVKLKSFTNSLRRSSNNKSFRKNIEQMTTSHKSMPSIIAKDVKIEGDIKSSGVIEIEGEIKGQIDSNSIIIRESGSVEGDIKADSINIRGQFSGNVKARNINIFNKAKVSGNIEYDSLSVEDGASIDGQFKRFNNKDSENMTNSKLKIVKN